MNEHEIVTEIVKKSRLYATGQYDLHKLQSAGEHFLPLTWKEQEEEVEFSYSIKRMHSFTEVRNESMEVILSILIQIAGFSKDQSSYSFSMEPGNLYYNSNGRVCIKTRDLRERQQDVTETSFLLSYKALIACGLTGKYSYQDYLEGGEELLSKTPVTAPLLEITTVWAVEDYLENLKREHLNIQRSTKILVSRVGNIVWKIAAGVLTVTTIVLGVYGSIQYFKEIPYLTAVAEANNAYIENDNVKLIDALKDLAAEEMDKHQKFILAKAYLQSENLSEDQKENRLGKLSLSSNEKELDYWIALGRMTPEKGEDLAMQLSDDELLLYAYLKDKEQVQSDTKIAGSEKEERLADIQGKIDNLKEEYNLGKEEG
jgi:type VII secretion protein EssB